jgi:hypothetical protein
MRLCALSQAPKCHDQGMGRSWWSVVDGVFTLGRSRSGSHHCRNQAVRGNPCQSRRLAIFEHVANGPRAVEPIGERLARLPDVERRLAHIIQSAIRNYTSAA